MKRPVRPAIKPATLDDVARIAGVSAKTVSRVANRHANVSTATRERVEAAIRDTGYRVNQAARSLAASRSFLIGAFMPHMPAFYFSEIFRGAAKACRHYGYHLVVEEFDHGPHSVVDRYERGLRGTHCDALILTPPVCDDERLLDALDRDGVPYVRIAPGKQLDRSVMVAADEGIGVRQLARHLWDGGRRRFAIIAGPAEHAAAAFRETCFRDAVAALGGDAASVRLARIELDQSIAEAGRIAALDLLRDADPLPDAIFAFNDEVAIGTIAAIRELDRSVPRDIAVAGFDDGNIAQLVWPQLTTVHQPIADLAFQAVGIIANMDVKEGAAGNILLPTHLVVRGTA
jgi:LacI family transcriptional regulator